jgi:hypothetical protein
VQESRQVMDDLSPWLKKAGFFDLNGFNGVKSEQAAPFKPFRIYFCPLMPAGTKISSGFGYLIRRSVCCRSDAAAGGRRVTETIEETLIQSEAPDGQTFLKDPNVRIINITAMVDTLVEKLDRKNG